MCLSVMRLSSSSFDQQTRSVFHAPFSQQWSCWASSAVDSQSFQYWKLVPLSPSLFLVLNSLMRTFDHGAFLNVVSYVKTVAPCTWSVKARVGLFTGDLLPILHPLPSVHFTASDWNVCWGDCSWWRWFKCSESLIRVELSRVQI